MTCDKCGREIPDNECKFPLCNALGPEAGDYVLCTPCALANPYMVDYLLGHVPQIEVSHAYHN